MTSSTVIATAQKKAHYYRKNKLGYTFLTMQGGIYISFGMLLLVTIGGYMDPQQIASMKVVQGVSFGVALTMVLMIGADLFTGNHFVMTVGTLAKKTTWSDTIGVWVYSYFGNFVGAFLCAVLFYMTGLATGDLGEYIQKLATIKMSPGFMELLARGILCNILVCMGVYASYKLQNEAAKIIVIFCCIYPFITMGFEHSIANMLLFSLSLIMPHGADVTLTAALGNLLPVTIGNIIGGAVFVGGFYWMSTFRKEK